jgi:hypothetical protein
MVPVDLFTGVAAVSGAEEAAVEVVFPPAAGLVALAAAAVFPPAEVVPAVAGKRAKRAGDDQSTSP